MEKKKGKGGKKKGGDENPGDWPIGKTKEKVAEAEIAKAKSRFTALQQELVQRNRESSIAQAELNIALKKRDEARNQTVGMGGDIISVQRDFARLFKVLN
jgi:multidrug efflux pump subunit AcrA (membrane-fusion protein)